MDWLSIASIIDERRLGNFGRILSLEPSGIYKNVAMICMYQSIFQQTEVNIGPTHRTLLTAKKYGLVKTIYQAVETGLIQRDWKIYVKGKIYTAWKYEYI